MNNRKRWPLVLATVPMWGIAWILISAAVARVQLGFWPRYGHPDPKELRGSLFFEVVGLALYLLAPVAVLMSLAALFRSWYRGQPDWRHLLTACFFGLLIAWVHFDPGGFVDWFFD